jgi:hypothetical protein
VPDYQTRTSSIEYLDGEQKLRGFLAMPKEGGAERPGVLIAPEWWGRAHSQSRCRHLMANRSPPPESASRSAWRRSDIGKAAPWIMSGCSGTTRTSCSKSGWGNRRPMDTVVVAGYLLDPHYSDPTQGALQWHKTFGFGGRHGLCQAWRIRRFHVRLRLLRPRRSSMERSVHGPRQDAAVSATPRHPSK